MTNKQEDDLKKEVVKCDYCNKPTTWDFAFQCGSINNKIATWCSKECFNEYNKLNPKKEPKYLNGFYYRKGQEAERKRICRIILQLVDMDGLLYLDELMEKIKEKKCA